MDADPTDPVSYRAAADELEQILVDLDDDHLDVDVLAGKVRRASQLIAYCRSRIAAARMEVEQIVADLDQAAQPSEAPPNAADDPPTVVAPAPRPGTTEPAGPQPGDDPTDPTAVRPIDPDADPTLAAPANDITAIAPPPPGAP